jgi:glycosyltransferase involved in cell wall biosynthesis
MGWKIYGTYHGNNFQSSLRPVVYLTFNDAPSGIYAGQVIDVCKFLAKIGRRKIVLIAFISIRNFSENKLKIKAQFPDAIVLRMFPKMRNWKLNRFFLKKYIRRINPEVIIARGPFAANLALNFKEGRKICFDGRGAYVPELIEYNVVPDEKIKNEIGEIERKAIHETDFRIAVSNALVNYWKEQFQYSGAQHVVIPCTLNSNSFHAAGITDIDKSRKELDLLKQDRVIVYSGSNAGWQSLEDLSVKLTPLFRANSDMKLVLMLKIIPASFSMLKEFPGRVKQKWTNPEQVAEVLSACDYGWLVREKSVTNQVASPVKFAEYLAAGLSVIISPELGDYTDFVNANACGIVWKEGNAITDLPEIPLAEKTRFRELATNNFSKESFIDQYLDILK